MRQQLIASSLIVAGMLFSACSSGSNGVGNGAFVPNAAGLSVDAAANAIGNPGFETGKLPPWAAFGQRTGVGTVVSTQHHSGKYSAFMGTSQPPAVNGAHGIQQTVTVPKNGVLTFWHEGNSTDQASYGYDEIDVAIGKAKPVPVFGGKGTSDTKLGWKKATVNLAKYAGKKVTLEFYVTDNGYAKADVNWYIDDVSLVAGK